MVAASNKRTPQRRFSAALTTRPLQASPVHPLDFHCSVVRGGVDYNNCYILNPVPRLTGPAAFLVRQDVPTCNSSACCRANVGRKALLTSGQVAAQPERCPRRHYLLREQDSACPGRAAVASATASETKQSKGGLKLDSREDIIKGGLSGPAVVLGNPDSSLLIRALRRSDNELKMPPKDDRQALGGAGASPSLCGSRWVCPSLPRGSQPQRST